MSEANRDIHIDHPTGCQLIWVASAFANIMYNVINGKVVILSLVVNICS